MSGGQSSSSSPPQGLPQVVVTAHPTVQPRPNRSPFGQAPLIPEGRSHWLDNIAWSNDDSPNALTFAGCANSIAALECWKHEGSDVVNDLNFRFTTLANLPCLLPRNP
jgi:hypothetical protein